MPRVVTRFVRASCERWGHMGEFELRRVRISLTKRASENPRANCEAFGRCGGRGRPETLGRSGFWQEATYRPRRRGETDLVCSSPPRDRPRPIAVSPGTSEGAQRNREGGRRTKGRPGRPGRHVLLRSRLQRRLSRVHRKGSTASLAPQPSCKFTNPP